MLHIRRCTVAWRIGVGLLLAGCGPEVSAFDIQPRRVCAGDSVHITWKARGTPRLESVRRTEDSVEMIRYTLVAESRGKTASRQLDVITYSPGAPASLAFDTDPLGRDSLVARDSLRAATWHSLLHVGDVSTDSGRQLLVRHAGVDGLVGPGRKASAAWRGKPMSGAWEMRSALTPREVRGKPAKHPSLQLFLKLNVVCDAT